MDFRINPGAWHQDRRKHCLLYTSITSVYLPSALPSVFTGLRLGMGSAWTCVVGAEMIAASSGIGYMISYARELAQPAKEMCIRDSWQLCGKWMKWLMSVLQLFTGVSRISIRSWRNWKNSGIPMKIKHKTEAVVSKAAASVLFCSWNRHKMSDFETNC